MRTLVVICLAISVLCVSAWACMRVNPDGFLNSPVTIPPVTIQPTVMPNLPPKPPAPAPRPAPPLVATFFQDCNFLYMSDSVQKRIGDYKMSNMGIAPMTISSIKVPLGLKVTLYERDNFEGRSTTITLDAPCLVKNPMPAATTVDNKGNIIITSPAGNWNDKVCSFKVEPN